MNSRRIDWPFILLWFVGIPTIWTVLIGGGLWIKHHI